MFKEYQQRLKLQQNAIDLIDDFEIDIQIAYLSLQSNITEQKLDYWLKPNGKISCKVLNKTVSKNRQKLKKMIIIKGVSREECDNILKAILAHMKKSNCRSQVNKMIRYHKDLWRNKEYVTRKNIRTKSC